MSKRKLYLANMTCNSYTPMTDRTNKHGIMPVNSKNFLLRPCPFSQSQLSDPLLQGPKLLSAACPYTRVFAKGQLHSQVLRYRVHHYRAWELTEMGADGLLSLG